MAGREDCHLSTWLVLIYVNIAPGEQAACGSRATKVRKTEHRPSPQTEMKEPTPQDELI
jgi:hypothetical protein